MVKTCIVVVTAVTLGLIFSQPDTLLSNLRKEVEIQPDQEEMLSVRDMLSDGILVLEILDEEEKVDEEIAPIMRKRTQTLPSNPSSQSQS